MEQEGPGLCVSKGEGGVTLTLTFSLTLSFQTDAMTMLLSDGVWFLGGLSGLVWFGYQLAISPHLL